MQVHPECSEQWQLSRDKQADSRNVGNFVSNWLHDVAKYSWVFFLPLFLSNYNQANITALAGYAMVSINMQFLFTRCWVDGWDVRPAGTEMWFACIKLICTVSQTKSSTLCWALFLMLYYTWKRTSQDSNGAGFKKKKNNWWITDDSWEARDDAGVCTLQVFQSISWVKLQVCVRQTFWKKKQQFFYLEKKITTECFALFTHMLIVFTKCRWKGKKKNLLALLCYIIL